MCLTNSVPVFLFFFLFQMTMVFHNRLNNDHNNVRRISASLTENRATVKLRLEF